MNTKLITLSSFFVLAACASSPPQVVSSQPELTPAPRAPVQLGDLKVPPSRVDIVPPQPMTNQLRPTEKESLDAVAAANSNALVLPTLNCFTGSTCKYWYEQEKPFRVNTAVGDLTFVCAKPGEVIGEAVIPGHQEWIHNQQYSYGDKGKRRECIGLMPNGVLKDGVHGMILTPDRAYELDIRTYKSKKFKHFRVVWEYPEDYLAQLNSTQPATQTEEPGRDRKTGLHPRERFCGYDMDGGTPAWRPVPTGDQQPPICDDGEVIIINFKPGVLGPYQSPGLWRVENGIRLPVDYKRHNATYIVTGIYDKLLLTIGAEEIAITRTQK